jgi:hypothetical protein
MKALNMNKFLAVLAGLLVGGFSLLAQTDSVRLGYTVRGNVVDALSGKALESVHVSIPERHYATVTNADGDFVIKSDRAIGTLVFSYVGYKTAYQRVGDGDMKVRLTPETLQLAEAMIVSADPLEVVRSAIYKIPENYSSQAELLECFYRETIRKGSRYTYISEAVARMYKNSYRGSLAADRTALEKSRVLLSQRKRDTLSIKVQGGPTLAMTFDMVKNRDLLLNERDMELYVYEMDHPTYIEDRPQFVVTFHPRRPQDQDYAMYSGTMFIDMETLSFTRIEMSLDMSDKGKATRMMLVRKPLTLRFTPREASMVITYRKGENGKFRLGYFRSTMRFGCDWRRRLFQTNYTAVNELVVTDLREPATPIDRKDIFRVSDIMNDKAAEFLDPDFWEDYNIIEPSESLEHAIGRLKKQIQ